MVPTMLFVFEHQQMQNDIFSSEKVTNTVFFYKIDHTELERVSEVNDLGVLFNCTLSYAPHIDIVISKAYSMLGFLMRICADINAAAVFISLYYAYVR